MATREIESSCKQKYQFIKLAYIEVKAIVKKALDVEFVKALAVFIGRFDNVVTSIGYDYVCFYS